MKNIGIVVGVVVLGTLGTVTFIQEQKSSNTIVDTSPVSTTSTNPVTVPTAVSNTTSPSQSKKSTISRWFSDDDGEGEDGGSNTTATTIAVPPPATTPKNYVAIYKDGTYSANGVYNSPGGQDTIAVTVTLAKDIITDATVTTVVADNTSLKYQNRFISGYKQYVIGQNIANVQLTVISGSSLTPKGFNSALALIKAKAKA